MIKKRKGTVNMLSTAMIFGDKMVLQREKPIAVWGSADPGAEVKVSLDGAEAVAAADESGSWKVSLPAHAAARGLTLTAESGGEKLAYTDVSVGEVWIAGGQSNMEFYLGFEKNYEEVLASFESEDVRFFDYPDVAYEGELNDRNYIHEGFWRSSTREDLGYFSAVGFYFARDLQRALGVPVGIVGCNWSGTTASAWMDPAFLRGTPGEIWLRDYEKFEAEIDKDEFMRRYLQNPMNDTTDRLALPFNIKSLKIGLTQEEQAAAMQEIGTGDADVSGFVFAGRPGGLYSTMVRKIAPYTSRGVIWYQGESDGDAHPEVYDEVFSRMIANWRELWADALPFLFVQLAPFRKWMMSSGDNYGIVRKCQEEVSKTVAGTWMTTTGDAGMEYDIHPKNKKPVGERLALLALGHVYGQDILCDPPELESACIEEKSLILTFRNAEGLHLKGECVNALQLVTEEGNVLDASEGEIIHGKLVVDLRNTGCPDVRKIREIRFAQELYYEVNLYNGAGIPAKPFVRRIV